MPNQRILIPAFDGLASEEVVIFKITELLSSVTSEGRIADYISYLKFNDFAHAKLADLMPSIRDCIKSFQQDIGIMNDHKLPDVMPTNLNILDHYKHSLPDLITVSSNVSIKTFLKLRMEYPQIKIALVSLLTDISEKECLRRYNMTPGQKILQDVTNIREMYHEELQRMARPKTGFPDDEPFNEIVCSGWELPFLKERLPDWFGFDCPGARNAWMKKDHQERTFGVGELINMGATGIPIGAQLFVGNPDEGIKPIQSRDLTIVDVKKSKIFTSGPFVDLPQLLIDHQAFYLISENKGPAVRYAGTYTDGEDEKHYYGFGYVNFRKIDTKPVLLETFAKEILFMAKRDAPNDFDVLLGAPIGGYQLATVLGQLTGKDTIYAKKTKDGEGVELDVYRIRPGQRVVIVEDVCNNFSTTQKLKDLIESQHGTLVQIFCAVNRSEVTEWQGYPVISALHKPMPQFRQDDPLMAPHIASGNFVDDVKKDWAKLKEAMSEAPVLV